MDRERSGGGRPLSGEAPIEEGGPRIAREVGAAAGPKGVAVALAYATREAGVARSVRTLLHVNQTDGFDCPSCAWPDPRDRSTFEFCENGAKAVGDEATQKRVTPAFFAEHSLSALREKPDHWLNKQGRLTHPVLLREGSDCYEAIGWDDAFALVARELRAMESPHEAAFYTSGRTSNEAAFLYQLFVRALGTNNLPDCSNMCHESSGTGMMEVLGTGKGTVSLEDFERADAIFVIGQNPGTNHPRMLSALRDARARGCRIVAMNPLREAALLRFKHPQAPLDWIGPGAEIADVFLQVRIGGDIAALKGLMKAVLAAERARPGEVLDHAFLQRHTDGFEALVADLDATPWERVLEESGLTREAIQQAADVAIGSKRTIACWAMGITQHEHGVANVQAIVNLLLLRGQIGRPGAGVCPVRGHSNVQGDRTMGIWEKPPAWTFRMGEALGFAAPREKGHDVVGAIRAMRAGKVRVFFGLGGNFLSASPDTDATAEGLRRCRLTVHVSTKLNRSHLVTGERALVLPCLGRTERDVQASGPQFVSVEDSMSIVHRSEGRLTPASEALLSEPAIVARLAAATLGATVPVDWRALAGDYDRIRDLVARFVPGFERYNERVRAPGGFVLPNPARERSFPTATGRARLTVHPIPRRELADGQLLLATIRTHDQFNTVVYDVDDRYRGIHGHRRVVLMNRDDLRARGLEEGERVTLRSHFRGELRSAPGFVTVAFDIPRGCAATYFPEANVLVPLESHAEKSRTPASKSIVVSVHRESP